MKAILILVVLLVSCGVINEAPKDMPVVDSTMSLKDGFVSISDLPMSGRLRPLSTKYVTPDNTYTLANVGQFYDTVLMTECSPGIAKDGQQRCIPKNNFYSLNYFSDNACSIPIIANICGQVVPQYVSVQISMCGLGGYFASSVYRVGSKVLNVYQKAFTCNAVPAGSPYDFYLQGAEVLPADMVAIQTSSVW